MQTNRLSDNELDQVTGGGAVDANGNPIETKIEWPFKSWDDVEKAWKGFVKGAKEVLGAA